MFIRTDCSADVGVSPQWIGIDDCRKPIKHGPTLAGLPGGLAGDLMRLYPVQSNEQYPVKVSFVTILGEYSLFMYLYLHSTNLEVSTKRNVAKVYKIFEI